MKGDTRETYQERVLRVLLFIQEHLDEPISLEDLARVAHLSPYHFHRVFRGMVGEGVMEHVRRLRLERAAHQLTGTRWSVTRIAFEAGYETHESFTRAFRAMFGEPPSRFRQKRGWQGRGRAPSGVCYQPGGREIDFTPVKQGGPAMQAEIREIEPMKVVFLRHVGPYDQVGPTWGRLCEWAGPKGLLTPTVKAIGLCHDDPEVTPQDKIRYDACLTLAGEVVPEGDIGVQEIPGGRYVVALHRGPFSGLKDFYARLCGEWISSRGLEIKSGPSLEVCLKDPDETPPEEIETEVYIPLED